MKQQIVLALKSRTFWSTVALFVVNGFPAVKGSIPTDMLPLADAILGMFIIFFHLNPSQKYNDMVK